jgi:hypothetical protein
MLAGRLLSEDRGTHTSSRFDSGFSFEVMWSAMVLNEGAAVLFRLVPSSANSSRTSVSVFAALYLRYPLSSEALQGGKRVGRALITASTTERLCVLASYHAHKCMCRRYFITIHTDELFISP